MNNNDYEENIDEEAIYEESKGEETSNKMAEREKNKEAATQWACGGFAFCFCISFIMIVLFALGVPI